MLGKKYDHVIFWEKSFLLMTGFSPAEIDQIKIYLSYMMFIFHKVVIAL